MLYSKQATIGEDMEVEASGFHFIPDSFIGASSDGKLLCRNVDICSRDV